MIWAVVFALFALLPLVGGDYLLQIGSFVAIQSIAVIGLGLLTGFAGRISLAQGALMGIGAYTTALLVTRLGVPPMTALPAAIAMSVLVGTILGSPAIRLSGLYFVMSTIGLQQIVWIVLMHWSSLTNGPQGVRAIPPLSLGGFAFDTPGRFYLAALFASAVSFFLARRVVASRFGLFLRAVSDDELSSGTAGVHVVRTKVLALALSSGWAGAAGFLQAFFLRFVHPDMFGLDLSVVHLTMAMFGGYRSLDGMLLSSVLLGSASEYLRPFGQFRLIVYGFILLLTMIIAPRGILAAAGALWRRR
jgi:branched-chain amino acid transport system permease protein